MDRLNFQQITKCILLSFFGNIIYAPCGYAIIHDSNYDARPADVGNNIAKADISFLQSSFKMILVPKGQASIGCNQVSDAVKCSKFETPQFNVAVASFYMMETEVSFGLWHACVKDQSCQQMSASVAWYADDMPVVNVSWNEINTQFIPWLNHKTGMKFRLPTEYEWEYAAAAGEQKDYTWENEVVIHNASCANCGSQWDNKQPVPVKFFKANAFGLFNMLGNVAEWASDCFERNHTWFIEKREKKTVCESHPIKGGAWVNATFVLVPHSRVEMRSDSRYEHIGFRLVADNIHNLKVAELK